MKYIEKNNLDDANRIIDPYLSYARGQRWFLFDDIYKSHFTKFWGKRDLIDSILLPEQDFRCCYCMKRLNPIKDPDATIEHLIPRSVVNGCEFTQYFDLNYPCLNSVHVCHTDDYKNGTNDEGQYPHHVAYHNFSIACHDCNEKRGNFVIGFPFLLPSDRQPIVYNRKTGQIELKDSCSAVDSIKFITLINRVGLNRPFLKAVRALWFYGKDHPTANYSTPDTVKSKKDRYELINNAFGEAFGNDPDINMLDLNAFIALESDGMWTEVLKYDYFSSLDEF